MKEKLDRITQAVIGAAIAVHKQLGPGLLESAYEACLAYELADRGHTVERQKSLPVRYREVLVDCGYFVDLLVDGQVVVELKAVEELHPIHKAQLLTYLKLSGRKVGLLINFHVPKLKDRVTRMVNDLPE